MSLCSPRANQARSTPPANGAGSLLSHEELATLWHPPTAMVGAERMQTVGFRELEPPAAFYSGKEPGGATIGRVLFRDDTRMVGIDEDSRRGHLHIVGATGTGKSMLLSRLIGWIVDQVKAYSPHRPVTADDVPAILGVLTRDQNDPKAS